MSCKYPNIIMYEKNTIYLKSQNPETEEPKGTRIKFIPSNSPHFQEYEYYLQVMKDLKKDHVWQTIKDNGHEVGFKLVPCRTCIGCRLQQTKDWAIRVELEAKKYKHNYFLTLTYDPKHLPMKKYTISEETGEIYTPEMFSYNWKGTLDYRDVQLFLKRLRKYFKTHYLHDGIRFYLAAEYGSVGQRPHYHIILMNCPDLDETLYYVGMNRKTGHPYYSSNFIEELWGKGFITIGKVNWDTISYTVGYCQKKLFGKIGKEIYAIKGQEPEFSKMSLKPGIGREYFNANWKKIYKNDEIINGKGQSVRPPAYFDRLMGDIGEEDELEAIKEARQEYANNEMIKKMSQTTKTLKEQLKTEESALKEKQKYYNRERI